MSGPRASDAVADPASLHARSPSTTSRPSEGCCASCRTGRAGDLSAYATAGEPPVDVRAALRFLLTERLAQLEEDWRFAGGSLSTVPFVAIPPIT
jgi:hypothetical protein